MAILIVSTGEESGSEEQEQHRNPVTGHWSLGRGHLFFWTSTLTVADTGCTSKGTSSSSG
jgi:hypothetical protein